MRKKQFTLVIVAVLCGVVSCPLVHPKTVQAAEPSVPTPSANLPEGSDSVIESLAWRVAGNDPLALREQAKALVRQIPEAVIVKENENLLAISLPTQKLSSLRQELSKLGSITAPTAETEPSAPTTLLRLTFVRP